MRPATLMPLLLAICLGACGDLPAPFWGNPGATARRLAQPPTPVLAVPVPTGTLLPSGRAPALADEISAALQALEVPATPRQPRETDWRLLTRAEQRGDAVVPIFVIQDPQGKPQGNAEGDPVPEAAWNEATPAALRDVAARAAPRILEMLSGIRLARDKADPNSLFNRPAKVVFTGVTGAPGDGNASLTRHMRARLTGFGMVLPSSDSGGDFTLRGDVTVVPAAARLERVEILWVVTGADGIELGKVVQLNEIPAGTLDRYWGDVAIVVASEAAGGVKDVIQRQTVRDPPKK